MGTYSITSDPFIQQFTEIERDKIITSITHYRQAGIEFEIISTADDIPIVIIRQVRVINGLLLTNKQLYDRAKKVFPGYKLKIKPVVYRLDLQGVNIEWVNQKMEEFGIKKGDLIRQLGIEKDQINMFLSKKVNLTIIEKTAIYYYFMVYEINIHLREHKD